MSTFGFVLMHLFSGLAGYEQSLEEENDKSMKSVILYRRSYIPASLVLLKLVCQHAAQHINARSARNCDLPYLQIPCTLFRLIRLSPVFAIPP